MIDPYTYGNTPAAINLVSILEEREHPHWSRLASRQIHAFNRFLAEIDDTCLSFQKKRYVAWLHLKEVKRTIYENEGWIPIDEKIKTHVLSVIQSRYRWMLKVWKYSQEVNKVERHVKCLGVRIHPMWKARKVT